MATYLLLCRSVSTQAQCTAPTFHSRFLHTMRRPPKVPKAAATKQSFAEDEVTLIKSSAQGQPTPEKLSKEKEPKVSPARHILIADDDAATRELLGTLLRDEGYRVSEAASGQEALDGIQAGTHDLVLLDMRMPGMTGMDVLKEIHQEQGDVPVIFTTAHGSPNTAIQASSLGAYSYIT